MNWYFKFKRYLKDKNVRHTINKVLEGYDFDYAYLLDIELSKMKAMYDYFSKYGMSESNDRMLQTLKRTITILDLLLNEDFCEVSINEVPDPSSKLEEIVGKVEYRCLVNVNFSNIKRFLPEVDEVSIDIYKKFPDILYMEKLWNLYNKMRAEYTRTWWD